MTRAGFSYCHSEHYLRKDIHQNTNDNYDVTLGIVGFYYAFHSISIELLKLFLIYKAPNSRKKPSHTHREHLLWGPFGPHVGVMDLLQNHPGFIMLAHLIKPRKKM